MSRPIALLSDFGSTDSYVGQLKSIIAGMAPDSPVIDISHSVRPHDVTHGAFMLGTAVGALPSGAVVIAVVDPGVGSARARALLVTTDLFLVGPDNGILWPLAADLAASGERADFYELDNPSYWRNDVAPTFEGRDIFAPAAAHLAVTAPDDLAALLADIASPLPNPVRLQLPATRRSDGEIEGRVIHQDHFGNLITNIRTDQIKDPARTRVAVHDGVRRLELGNLAHAYTKYDHLVSLIGSSGHLELAIPTGSAARMFGTRSQSLRIFVTTN